MFGLLKRSKVVRTESGELPLPPLELRELVGNVGESAFGNPTGARVFPATPATADDFILDFGCGCGRVARQLMLQSVPPRRYLGLDLHRGMIRWCRENLTSRNPNFTFEHQNVYNPGLNPKGRRRQIAFPAGDRSVSLLIAQSVFTHLVESQAQFYLRETGRVLRDDGVAAVTFFLFDKAGFPMMQEFQNALYINLSDPTNAVIFDRDWLCRTAMEAGLRISRAEPPAVRGFHWQIQLQRARPGAAEHVPFPPDEALSKPVPPPLLVKGAHRLGT